jgi:hypothetical protein
VSHISRHSKSLLLPLHLLTGDMAKRDPTAIGAANAVAVNGLYIRNKINTPRHVHDYVLQAGGNARQGYTKVKAVSCWTSSRYMSGSTFSIGLGTEEAKCVLYHEDQKIPLDAPSSIWERLKHFKYEKHQARM